MTGKEPVVERRARAPQVKVAGGAGRKAYADRGGCHLANSPLQIKSRTNHVSRSQQCWFNPLVAHGHALGETQGKKRRDE